MQVTIFLVVFFIFTLFLTIACFKQNRSISHYRSNTDALIGKQGIVLSVIQPQQPGYVKIEGEIWPARCEDHRHIEADSIVVITAVQGCHLIVQKTILS